MFSKITHGLKQLGKKAIGYVRGLNGDKAAALASAALSKIYPTAGFMAAPFLSVLGSTINSKIDEWLKNNPGNTSGGISKPSPALTQRRSSFRPTSSNLRTLYPGAY